MRIHDYLYLFSTLSSKSFTVINWPKLGKSSRYVTVGLPTQLRKSLIKVFSWVILLISQKSLKVCLQYLNSKAESFASWLKGNGNGAIKFAIFIYRLIWDEQKYRTNLEVVGTFIFITLENCALPYLTLALELTPT